MKLRLFHHHDGARVAFREAGVGPALILLHSAGLSHREFEPLVEELRHRFRVVLPDLPLHGDSEDRPRHAYSRTWFAEVMGAFCHDVGGPSPIVGGHGVGGEIVLDAIQAGQLRPQRVILLPMALGRAARADHTHRALRALASTAAVPGLDRAIPRLVPLVVRPAAMARLTSRADTAAEDVIRHAVAGIQRNPSRAQAWRRAARAWKDGAQPNVAPTHAVSRWPAPDAPTLLLWADRDVRYPTVLAEQAHGAFPDAHVRILSGTGFLIAYDDPVGVAREILAFCR